MTTMSDKIDDLLEFYPIPRDIINLDIENPLLIGALILTWCAFVALLF